VTQAIVVKLHRFIPAPIAGESTVNALIEEIKWPLLYMEIGRKMIASAKTGSADESF